MKNVTYFVILADRSRSHFFTITNGSIGRVKEYRENDVPQKVKHGDDTWDAQNKIFRHIEDHLHRHLLEVGKNAKRFIADEDFSSVIIGSHSVLFPKIIKTLPEEISQKVMGKVIVDIKSPFNDILKKITKLITTLEKKNKQSKASLKKT